MAWARDGEGIGIMAILEPDSFPFQAVEATLLEQTVPTGQVIGA